jgi:hypothetical protein
VVKAVGKSEQAHGKPASRHEVSARKCVVWKVTGVRFIGSGIYEWLTISMGRQVADGACHGAKAFKVRKMGAFVVWCS